MLLPPDIMEMALTGGSCDWSAEDLDAYREYCAGMGAGGTAEWRCFDRDHSDFMARLSDAEDVATEEALA